MIGSYWGEIDIEDSDGANAPLYIHRILWQTCLQNGRDAAPGYTYMLSPEIELRFGDFEITITPNNEGIFARPDDFITVVRDPNKLDGMESRRMSL